MGEKLTWKEIEEKYNHEWVLLDDFDWPDGTPYPKSGIVICHSQDRKEFNQLVHDSGAINIARVFVGKPKIPENVLVSYNMVRKKYAVNTV